MEFDSERWIKVYTRDTTNLLMLSWQARGLLWSILRKLDPAGVLELGAHGPRALIAIMRIPPGEWDEAKALLDELTASGSVELLERDGSWFLIAPNFVEAQARQQPGTEAAKKRRQRARRKAIEAKARLFESGGDIGTSVSTKTPNMSPEGTFVSELSPLASPEKEKEKEKEISPKPPQGGDTEGGNPRDEVQTVVDRYLEHWRREVGRGTPPKFAKAKRGHIRARLREFDLATVLRVVDSFWANPWWDQAGRNRQPSHVFGSLEAFEKRLARADQVLGPPPPPELTAEERAEIERLKAEQDERIRRESEEMARRFPPPDESEQVDMLAKFNEAIDAGELDFLREFTGT